MTVFVRSSTSKELEPGASGQPQDVASRAPQDSKPTAQAPGSTSLISAALTVIGQLQSAGDIQIDGKVEGDIRGNRVKIGNDAVIKGTVFAESVELSGTLEGNIDAKNVFLTKTARMSGNVLHKTLQVEHGAYFNGNSQPQRAKSG